MSEIPIVGLVAVGVAGCWGGRLGRHVIPSPHLCRRTQEARRCVYCPHQREYGWLHGPRHRLTQRQQSNGPQNAVKARMQQQFLVLDVHAAILCPHHVEVTVVEG